MPEGDSIHRAAARLRPALEGRALRRFEAPRWSGPTPAVGERIERVVAVGKHLVVEFGGGLALRVHLGLHGAWHLYRPDERWRRSPGGARAILGVDDWVAVAFAAPVVEVTPAGRAAVGHLGPDLCDAEPDLDRVLANVAARGDPAAPIGEVLMDQRVAAGIGNIYKSETLFAERLDPTTPVGAIAPERLRAVYARAHRLLRANLVPGRRRQTVPGGYAVYRRANRACRRCGTRIRRIVQGAELPRSTYFCPGCQAPEPAGAGNPGTGSPS